MGAWIVQCAISSEGDTNAASLLACGPTAMRAARKFTLRQRHKWANPSNARNGAAWRALTACPVSHACEWSVRRCAPGRDHQQLWSIEMARRQITVTLTQEEYEVLQGRAKELGTTVPAFARLILQRDEIGLQALVDSAMSEQRVWLEERIAESEKRQQKIAAQLASVTVMAMAGESEREKVLSALKSMK